MKANDQVVLGARLASAVAEAKRATVLLRGMWTTDACDDALIDSKAKEKTRVALENKTADACDALWAEELRFNHQHVLMSIKTNIQL